MPIPLSKVILCWHNRALQCAIGVPVTLTRYRSPTAHGWEQCQFVVCFENGIESIIGRERIV